MRVKLLESYLKTLIGVPYRHQGRNDHLDCAGVIIHVCQQLDLPYEDFKGYERSGVGEIEDAIKRHGIACDKEIGPGIIYVFSRGKSKIANHVGVGVTLYDGREGMVHATDSIGCVTMTAMKRWHKRHISSYKFRGVDY